MPIDSAIADRWGLLASEAKHKGKVLAVIDGLLSATALHHNLTIASRNTSDFTAMQVQILNPWKV
jgi:predicted nucleic acid-binding protein